MSIKIATIYGTTFLGLFKHRPSIYAGLGLLSPPQLSNPTTVKPDFTSKLGQSQNFIEILIA